MNAKQFLSSALLGGVDFGISRVPVVGRVIAWPVRILFPTMGYERVRSTSMKPSVFISVFGVGFLVCFVLQALLAWRVGHLGHFDLTFGPTPDPLTHLPRIMFFDDPHNLFNYLVLVPLYLVAGTGYVISLFSLKERMAPISGGYGFHLDDGEEPLLSGTMAIGVFVILLVTLQAQYAVDVQQKSLHLFWFHGSSRLSSFWYNGYAYLVINTFLAGFVILVALLHLELFRWAYILSRGIRTYSAEEAGDENLFLRNGDRLREIFAPFTETAIWSKAFAMLLAINIYTWKASGVSGGARRSLVGEAVTPGIDENSWFFRFVFVLFVVIALWLVALPRYRVQYEIFKLRREKGIHEYFDIRMPWTVGWSVFIDVLLFAFFSTAIFGTSDIFDLFSSLFED